MRGMKIARVCFSVSALLVAALACGYPGSSADTGGVDLEATEAKRALETDVAHAKETAQPVSEGSAKPDEHQYTVLVRASMDTDCRTGPGEAYECLGTLREGEEAQMLARSEDGMYFYVRLPGVSPEDCWLWAQYAQVEGELRELPVYTPPPPRDTPTVEPGLVVQGHIRLADGTGLEGVTVCRRFASYDGMHVATTDADGYYRTEFSFIPDDEMVTVWAFHEGYAFDPQDYFWRHYYGYEVATRDFSATQSTEAEMSDCR